MQWDGKELTTYGDFIGAVSKIIEIGEEKRAKAFITAYTEDLAKKVPYRDAEQMAADNIGWLMGEYGFEKMRKGLALFAAAHPIFGSADAATNVGPQEAFEAGLRIGMPTQQAPRA